MPLVPHPFEGEGDGLPGLVIDVYGHVAVIKFDGPGASAFYDAKVRKLWSARVGAGGREEGWRAKVRI